ncbi:glycosyltransferase family 39 protein [Candidatus Poribacteria bacterium]|nr:glycosyltransferase family 39 protein [Candidatus Poribacteria bacterium]
MISKTRPYFNLLVLLAVCYFLFSFRIGAHDLWSPDEPRYAQVAREMLETGDWIVPHLNGEVYQEKPPLYFWLVAYISRPLGDVNETTARFPSAIAATLIVLGTYLFGRRILGEREAFLGSLIAATSAQYLWIGRIGVIDMLLALSILASLICFYFGHAKRRPPLYVAGYLFLVPAALSKGPVGIAVPVVVMLTFLAVEIVLRKESGKKQLAWFMGCTIIGLVLVGVCVGPWWRAAYERSDGVYGSLSLLKQQTEGRMFQSYSHRQPIYYYLMQILWQLFPWTVFLPLSAYAIKREGKLRENQGLRFLLVWFLSVFLFFTLISGKRSQYILPSFPAAGLILGWALVNSNPDEGRLSERRKFGIPLLLLSLGFAGSLIAASAAAYLRRPEYLTTALGTLVVSTAILVVLIRHCLSRPPRTALACLIGSTTLLVAVLFGYGAPLADRYNSARPFCSSVLAATGASDSLFFYKIYRPNVHFYMHRRMSRLESGADVKEALDKSRRVLLILQNRDRVALDLGPSYNTEEVARARIGSRDLICVAVKLAPAIGPIAIN